MQQYLVQLNDSINAFPNNTKVTNDIQALNNSINTLRQSMSVIADVQALQATLSSLPNTQAISDTIDQFSVYRANGSALVQSLYQSVLSFDNSLRTLPDLSELASLLVSMNHSVNQIRGADLLGIQSLLDIVNTTIRNLTCVNVIFDDVRKCLPIFSSLLLFLSLFHSSFVL
jgi:hypothetical protein